MALRGAPFLFQSSRHFARQIAGSVWKHTYDGARSVYIPLTSAEYVSRLRPAWLRLNLDTRSKNGAISSGDRSEGATDHASRV